MAKASLDNLRAIFREEFDDLLHVLGRQLDRAERSTASSETSAVAAEVRRAVHTLKGAARAAGYGELEAEFHRLETAIEHARAAGPPSARDVVATAREAITVANRFAPLVHGAPSEAALSIAIAPTSSDAGAPSFAQDTVRVDAVALARILDASENLVLEMSRGVVRTTQRTVDATTADLLRELEHVRRLAAVYAAAPGAHGVNELQRRLDRAVGSARTLAAATDARTTAETLAWASASTHAKTVAAAARSLRQERFEGLGAAASQAARDAAIEAGVTLRVVHEGDDVSFDRTLREPLREILLHLVRNAVAHGIEPSARRADAGKDETGLLVIAAEEGDGELRIVVRDDGCGIDLEAVAERARALGIDGPPLEALFAPGLSTRAAADELAGRGVGLDVVRQRVLDLHGRIEVETVRNGGTTFRIAVSPDLSVTRALVVRAGPFAVAIRLSVMDRIVRTPREEIRVASGRAHIVHDGFLLPLASLAAELGSSAAVATATVITSVITAAGERRIALAVDELIDEREIAIRPLQGRFREIPFVNGTTVLADGGLAWVLDVRSLAARAQGLVPLEDAGKAPAPRILVVDDSATTRELERALLRAAGFDVVAVADGEQAWLALQGGSLFDVVLTDVEMPRLDGFSLLGRIRATARLAQMPVVLVTALEAPSDRQRALDMGASAYILKSAFDEEQLLDVIAHLL